MVLCTQRALLQAIIEHLWESWNRGGFLKMRDFAALSSALPRYTPDIGAANQQMPPLVTSFPAGPLRHPVEIGQARQRQVSGGVQHVRGGGSTTKEPKGKGRLGDANSTGFV